VDISLKDKVALVTGASRGIGKAIVLALAQQGAIVIGTEINTEGAASIAQFLAAANLRGCGKVLDVTQQNSIDDLIQDIKAEFKPVDILVNNAGITQDNLMLRMKAEQWQAVIDTNLNSIFRMTQSCLRDMLKAHWGRIINISSVVGVTGNPGQANYCAAKAGMLGFTKSLAKEVAIRGVTVNAVAPGFIDTAMTQKLTEKQKEMILQTVPANNIGQPEDVAAAVVFFASPAAHYITGQTLHINGGMFMP
jgi:3-oxoacyl-[acyl-carrier protein] reductase